MPLLSLIVTAYNIEDFIDECMQTVIGQTLTDMEIIVVDDGSSDATPEIIRKYAEKDTRIRPIFLPENTMGGVASAANAGLDAATGKYIGFADGDDYLEPTMFDELCAAAEENQSDLAMCKYLESIGPEKETKEPAERMRWAPFTEAQCVPLDNDDNRIEILRFIAVPWRKIYSRRMLEENNIRFPAVDYFWEDNPFHWFSVCSANAIAIVPNVLCYHRVARAGQTMSTRDAGLLKMFGHYETIKQWLDERNLLNRFQAPLLGWAVSQFEWIQKRIPQTAGDQLFDIMKAILEPVDGVVLDRALQAKGDRTRKQVDSIRDGNREAFLKEFSLQFRNGSRRPGALTGLGAKPLSLVRLAISDARANGFRSTASKARQYLLGSRFRKKEVQTPGGMITEHQMLRFMALLQQDLDRKHAEQLNRLETIEEAVKEIRSAQDNV